MHKHVPTRPDSTLLATFCCCCRQVLNQQLLPTVRFRAKNVEGTRAKTAHTWVRHKKGLKLHSYKNQHLITSSTRLNCMQTCLEIYATCMQNCIKLKILFFSFQSTLNSPWPHEYSKHHVFFLLRSSQTVCSLDASHSRSHFFFIRLFPPF